MLITIAVIGVVAALTIATINNKINEHKYKTAYKQAYSDVNQALQKMLNQATYTEWNKDINGIGADISPEEKAAQVKIAQKNMKALAAQFKTAKTCFYNNACDCIANGEAGDMDDWINSCRNYAYAFIDQSGRSWFTYSITAAVFIVDIDGHKGPNKLGRDRFPFKYADENNNTAHARETKRVYPLYSSDIKRKERWCPSGNCFYYSWLFK